MSAVTYNFDQVVVNLTKRMQEAFETQPDLAEKDRKYLFGIVMNLQGESGKTLQEALGVTEAKKVTNQVLKNLGFASDMWWDRPVEGF